MKEIKIGVIGGGRIGKVHMGNIEMRVPGASVVRLADPYMNEELETWAAEHGVHNVSKDHRNIISDSDIDAVLICSPTDTHADITREAADAGKHVFCEKPLDQDPDVIRETLNTVENAGVVFQIGFNRRFDHNYRALEKSVRNGDVGDVHIVKITSRDPSPPPKEYIRSSGGLFMDMTIHDFDMARYLSGSEIKEVFAAGSVLVDPAIGEEGDIDTAIVNLQFENGAIGVIDNSRKAAYGYDQRAEVFGSKGCVMSGNDAASNTYLSNETGVHFENPLYFFLERYAESFAEEIRCFAAAIRDGGDAPVRGRDALMSVLAARAARESLTSGKPVRVEKP